MKKRVGDVYAEEVVKRHGTKYIVGAPAKILCKWSQKKEDNFTSLEHVNSK